MWMMRMREEEENTLLSAIQLHLWHLLLSLVSPPGDRAVIPPPSTKVASTGARITVRFRLPDPFTRGEVVRTSSHAYATPSPLFSLSPPAAGRSPRLGAPAPSEHSSPPPVPSPLLPSSRYEVVESSTTRPTGGRGIDYGFVSTVDAEARRQGIREVRYGDVLIVEEDAYASGEAWAHSIGLSQTVHHELQTHHTAPVIRDMRREMVDIQAELLALREQQRRARQPRPDARVPDYQEASKDVDSRI
ncbi:hypothetical protein Tco_1386753 [Tanacetum coccineum]